MADPAWSRNATGYRRHGCISAHVDELSFTVAGVIKDVDRLKLLYELFAATLDELCRIGSAYSSDPGVQVK